MKNIKMTILLITVLGFIVGAFGSAWAAENDQININTATVEQLVQLDRIGPQYAQRIIEYRQNMGPFEKPEDIMRVKGIGNRTWEANKNRIAVK